MRAIWNAVSVFCVANMLALGGVVGWLAATDRLDPERIREVRASLTETRAERESKAQAEAAKLAAEDQAKAKAVKDARPPMSAAEKLQARLEAGEVDTQRLMNMRTQVSAMQQSLREAQERIDQDRAALARDRAAFEAMIQETRSLGEDAQFRKALSALEGMDPKAASAMIRQIITGGEGSAGSALAIGYLNAMQDRKRNEILGAIAREEATLAADLLERLRTYGLAPAGR